MYIDSPEEKCSKILYFSLFCFFLIFLRVWHLSVVQKEEKTERAVAPQRKTIITEAKRGKIIDRFGIPLAVNRIRYDACVYYSQIKQIKSIGYEIDINGIKKRIYPRKNHIKLLSEKFADILGIDPLRVEDLIHAKASLFPNTPFTIKEGISEKQYYQIRALEKDFLGLHGKFSGQRHYPQKNTGAHLIGYIGAISQNQYLSIANEQKALQSCLDQDELQNDSLSHLEILNRLETLKKKAYTINDLIGKAGIESKLEKELRGYYGKKTYEVDVRGNFTRLMPGVKSPISGRGITLSISSELQEFAEKLLAKDEKTREGRSKKYDAKRKKSIPLKQPMIKGGAIVAMDPNTGQILALASYPRFDPNDFVPSMTRRDKIANIHKWLETKTHIANIWNGKQTLSKEIPIKDKLPPTSIPLTWETYLQEIIEVDTDLYEKALSINTLSKAIELQEACSDLLYYSGHDNANYVFDVLFSKDQGHISSSKPFYQEVQIQESLYKSKQNVELRKKKLLSILSNIPSNSDKLFLIDLARLAVNSKYFSNQLIEKTGDLSLSSYFKMKNSLYFIENILKQDIKKVFHTVFFLPWREKNEATFLKEKRKAEKTYAKPYIDYLDQKENQLFLDFWKSHKITFFLNLLEKTKKLPEELSSYSCCLNDLGIKEHLLELKEITDLLDEDLTTEFIHSIRFFSDLTRSLLGKYPRLGKNPLEKDLAACFYPKEGFSYASSYAYQKDTPLGSIFKIVTAYEALKKQYCINSNNLNPLTMIDEVKYAPHVKGSFIVGYTEDDKPYPRYYKGGRLPKSYANAIGKVDLLTALERSSNPYFSILAGDFINDPEDLITTSKDFGFGKKSGINLSAEYPGNLPKDLHENRTGLYSFAIGQHTLLATPLQTAVMLSAVANGGRVLKPQIIKKLEGDMPDLSPFACKNDFAYQQQLSLLNIHFPLFTQAQNSKKIHVTTYPPEVKKNLFLPDSIRQMILKGMDLVVSGEKGSARKSAIKGFYGQEKLKKDYSDLTHKLVGKTSTTEILYNPYIYPSSKAQIYKHIWFGSILFEEDDYKKPELVVVVYLKFGDGGKEAAPLALQMMTKWKEIKQKHPDY